jgi:hypothetical protein
MIDTALALLTPHYCSSCSKIGTTLCDNCKYDIVTTGRRLNAAKALKAAGPSQVWVTAIAYQALD